MTENVTRLAAVLAVNAFSMMGLSEGSAIAEVADAAQCAGIDLSPAELRAALAENRGSP